MTRDQVPGVSIIRPLRGIDCNMYENLASSFRQDYPIFEVIFSVAQPNDPAIAVVKDLMKKYPKVDARIIIGKLIGVLETRAHTQTTFPPSSLSPQKSLLPKGIHIQSPFARAIRTCLCFLDKRKSRWPSTFSFFFFWFVPCYCYDLVDHSKGHIDTRWIELTTPTG